MDFKEIIFLTSSSIKERRTRNLLTILMIIMGCGLLVSLSSLTSGLIYFVEQNFKNILPNQIIISSSDKIQQSNVENIRNKLEVLFDKDANLVEQKIPFDNKTITYLKSLDGVSSIDPAYQGVMLLSSENKTEVTNILAISFSGLSKIIPNFNNDKIMEQKQGDGNYIILSQKISEKIFPPSEMKNQTSRNMVTLQGVNEIADINGEAPGNRNNNFKVLATISTTENPIIDNSVFVETSKGKGILNKSGDYDLLFLTFNDVNKVDAIVKNIQDYFDNQITILNSLEIVKTLTKFIVGVSTFISSIAVFSLIVGALGIIITIYTSVMERTQEIGILKALGGTNRTILGMFLTESLIIGAIGAGIGVLFGFLGSHVLLTLLLYFLKIPLMIYPVFNLVEIAKITLVVILLSLLAGLYPAYKGSKISPVAALTKYF
jgi:putative ABC transport system permease protein